MNSYHECYHKSIDEKIAPAKSSLVPHYLRCLLTVNTLKQANNKEILFLPPEEYGWSLIEVKNKNKILKIFSFSLTLLLLLYLIL